jgi:hypothetical protein
LPRVGIMKDRAKDGPDGHDQRGEGEGTGPPGLASCRIRRVAK